MTAVGRDERTRERNDELTQEALAWLNRLRLRSLTASPNALRPGLSSTLIAWDVGPDKSPRGLRLLLQGEGVRPNGQRQFDQFDTETYTLLARMHSVQRLVGRITVPYDTSTCTSVAIPETLLKSLLANLISENIDQLGDHNLSLRSDPIIEISNSGISVKFRLLREINNFPDLKVNVDGVIVLSAESGKPAVHYRSFSIDMDWPWYVTTLSAGITKIVEEVAEGLVEDDIKQGMLALIRKRINDLVTSFPNYILHSLSTRSDEILATVCPLPSQE